MHQQKKDSTKQRTIRIHEKLNHFRTLEKVVKITFKGSPFLLPRINDNNKTKKTTRLIALSERILKRTRTSRTKKAWRGMRLICNKESAKKSYLSLISRLEWSTRQRLSTSRNDECKRVTTAQLCNLLEPCREETTVQRDDLKVPLEAGKEILPLVTSVHTTARATELEPSLNLLSRYKLVLSNKNIFRTPQKQNFKVSQEVSLKK